MRTAPSPGEADSFADWQGQEGPTCGIELYRVAGNRLRSPSMPPMGKS